TALSRLQQDVQKQGALQPWLERHGLAELGRLWQRLHIEPGWETALESVLRERMAGIELRQLEQAAALSADAPPSRLALYQVPAAAAPPAAELPLKPLASLLRITDPDLRTLLNEWLAGVYVCDDLAQAMSMRARLSRLDAGRGRGACARGARHSLLCCRFRPGRAAGAPTRDRTSATRYQGAAVDC